MNFFSLRFEFSLHRLEFAPDGLEFAPNGLEFALFMVMGWSSLH